MDSGTTSPFSIRRALLLPMTPMHTHPNWVVVDGKPSHQNSVLKEKQEQQKREITQIPFLEEEDLEPQLRGRNVDAKMRIEFCVPLWRANKTFAGGKGKKQTSGSKERTYGWNARYELGQKLTRDWAVTQGPWRSWLKWMLAQLFTCLSSVCKEINVTLQVKNKTRFLTCYAQRDYQY